MLLYYSYPIFPPKKRNKFKGYKKPFGHIIAHSTAAWAGNINSRSASIRSPIKIVFAVFRERAKDQKNGAGGQEGIAEKGERDGKPESCVYLAYKPSSASREGLGIPRLLKERARYLE